MLEFLQALPLGVKMLLGGFIIVFSLGVVLAVLETMDLTEDKIKNKGDK